MWHPALFSCLVTARKRGATGVGVAAWRYSSTIILPFMRSWPKPQNLAQTKS